MAKKEMKTNVMRALDSKKLPYKSYEYTPTGTFTGAEAAKALGKDPARVFKTLVTVGQSGEHYVFVVPVEKELDLKAAAKAVGEKNVEMIKQKELLPLTGYIHGGCSPIGMKKSFRTTIDGSAAKFETIIFSAGKVGHQVEVAPSDLKEVIDYSFAEITRE